MPLLAVAPGFHLPGTWPGRLQVGVPWRTPDATELASLVADGVGDHLCLFALPAHLLASFLAVLERAGGLPEDEARAFFGEVARFLEYKRLAPPAGAVFEIVASRQGVAADVSPSAIWGAANLGDEPTHVVFAAGGTPVRLRLEPGEGYRLPAEGMPMAGCTLGQEAPGVSLVIRPA